MESRFGGNMNINGNSNRLSGSAGGFGWWSHQASCNTKGRGLWPFQIPLSIEARCTFPNRVSRAWLRSTSLKGSVMSIGTGSVGLLSTVVEFGHFGPAGAAGSGRFPTIGGLTGRSNRRRNRSFGFLHLRCGRGLAPRWAEKN